MRLLIEKQQHITVLRRGPLVNQLFGSDRSFINTMEQSEQIEGSEPTRYEDFFQLLHDTSQPLPMDMAGIERETSNVGGSHHLQLKQIESEAATVSQQHVGTEPSLAPLTRSCVRCRKAKKGCDLQRPCHRCRLAGEGVNECVEHNLPGTRQPRDRKKFILKLRCPKKENQSDQVMTSAQDGEMSNLKPEGLNQGDEVEDLEGAVRSQNDNEHGAIYNTPFYEHPTCSAYKSRGVKIPIKYKRGQEPANST